MSTIANGSDRPLNIGTGTIPDVSGAMKDYFQPMTFTRIVKTVVGFQAKETPTDVEFMGVIQPLSSRALTIKPEGQRSWTWFMLHADPVLSLNTDEVITYNGVQTRVMARKDYSLYGYMYYELVQDWTGSGPSS